MTVASFPISSKRLKSFIERVEKLIEERKAIAGDIRDVFSEAKGVGYNVPIMRKVIGLRAMDAADRAEQEALLDVYLHALESIDRVEVRVASGESIRKAASAEGMSNSTAARHVSQNRAETGNGTDDETRGQTLQVAAEGRSEQTEPAGQPVNAALPSSRVSADIEHGEGSELGTLHELNPGEGAAPEQAEGLPAAPPEVPPDLVREIDPEAMGEAITADDLAFPAHLDQRKRTRDAEAADAS